MALSDARSRWISTALLFVVYLFFVGTAIGSVGTSVGNTLNLSLRPDQLGGTGQLLVAQPELLLLLLAGLVLCLALPRLPPLKASVLTLISVLPFIYRGVTNTGQALVPMEFALLTVLVLFGFHILTGWLQEARRRQRLVDLFGQYVPPELISELEQDAAGFEVEGEARQMSVMFADIKGFTSIAEKLDPKQLVRLLNEVFDPLTEIIHQHRGTVDKYMGDSVMAFWGAPARDPNHAEHAVLAALAIQAKLKQLRREFRARGLAEIQMGIGINSGVMNVGNIGSSHRVSYTVIGDAVNLAARLEGATRRLHTSTVVSTTTREYASAVLYRELGTVHVKGKEKSLRLFEPLCRSEDATPQLQRTLALHEQAIAAFYERDWKKSASYFGKLWEQHPEDRLYQMYLERVSEYAQVALPDDWAGTLEMPAELVRIARGEIAPDEQSSDARTDEYLMTLRGWKDDFSS